MKILFTGASSFTGYWFVKELVEAGHDVTITFQRSLQDYTGLRRTRIDCLLQQCTPVFNRSFGDELFLKMINDAPKWDLLCHHAADVRNYKSPSFDVAAALHNNTHNLSLVLESLKSKECSQIVLTGSVFEQNEGQGTMPLTAFSPYGLSKSFTSELFQYQTALLGMTLNKFVIPNPFGPFEEPRFTSYLIKTWFEGKCATVGTPNYIRDNIHVTLLAKAYSSFVKEIMDGSKKGKFNPSGYRESQSQFTERFAQAMRKRLSIPCEIMLAKQTQFNEPLARTNIDLLDTVKLGWDEEQAWDELAHYYIKTQNSG